MSKAKTDRTRQANTNRKPLDREEALGCKVDLTAEVGLRKSMREEVLRKAVRAA